MPEQQGMQPAFEPQPQRRTGLYLILGIVVLLVAGGIAFAWYWKNRATLPGGGVKTPVVLPPPREPTQAEKDKYNLGTGAVVGQVLTPNGIEERIYYPDSRGAPSIAPVQ